MHRLTLLCTLLLALPLFAQDYPPGEIRLAPQTDLHLESTPIEGLPGRTLNLPPGFKIKLFSNQVDKARFMAFDDSGILHLANMHTRGSSQWAPDPNRTSEVLALPDHDGDGRADSVYVAADDFLWPHSIAFYQGALYVADHDMIYKLRDDDGDGYYEEREEFIQVSGIMGRSSEHVTHTLVFDQKNDKLYLHVGSGCDLCRESDPERATILQFDADGSNRRIYASGVRNAIGLDLHPVTGDLWATGNGHDREGATLPPEWISVVPDGSFHGWPLAYGYQVWTDFSISQYRNEIFPLTREDSALVARIERPVALVPAHLAPMGLHFYTHEQFPAHYQNAAFVAFRAGVLGNDLGYKVMALFSDNDGGNARVADFITGFRPDPQSDSFWGTPVGLISDNRGYLYLSSDRFTQAIFRIEASPLQGLWENPPPDVLLGDTSLRLNSTVRIVRQLDTTQPLRVVADLSALGGPTDLPLERIDDRTYRLQTELLIGPDNGRKKISILLEQAGESNKLIRSLVVLPQEDLLIFSDELLWDQGVLFSAELDPTHADTVFAGQRALRIAARGFTIEWLPAKPVDPAGYAALRLAVHPGGTTGDFRPSFSIVINGQTDQALSLIERIDLADKQWQIVEVPLEELKTNGPIESLRLVGSLRGTFYLDDVRLVAARVPDGPTAVREEPQSATPSTFALAANYPNPFNASTTLNYRLDAAGPVRLEIYSLNGQKVKTLVDEAQQAGVYQVEWNGKDRSGRPVATGVYLARLEGNGTAQVRKMLLLK